MMEHGEQCVMMGGTLEKPWWFVDSLATQNKVCFLVHCEQDLDTHGLIV